MISRIGNALVRALCVVLLIVIPSIIMPGVNADTKQVVTLVGLCVGAFIFVEYSASYPSLIEFRDAPPFNRIRFMSLFVTVFSLSMMSSSLMGAAFFRNLGDMAGRALDFPYSPVRLARLVLVDTQFTAQADAVRNASALAFILALVSLAVFVIVLKVKAWPSRHHAFNVWTNLPTFEPTAAGDVVDRLERDARVNLSLGCLAPFLFPVVVNLVELGFSPLRLETPLTLIWTISLWVFVSTSLVMRGIAMGKVAQMICKKRNEHLSPADQSESLAKGLAAV